MSHKEHSFMPLLMNNAEKENRAEKERGTEIAETSKH